MLVKDIMKRPLVIEKDIGLNDAARIMGSKNIGSLLFMSGKKIKGIVTERDLIKNFGKHEKISQVMTKKVITITPDVALDVAAELMRDKKIKKLPVINGDKLVGVITLTDLIGNFEGLEEHFFFE